MQIDQTKIEAAIIAQAVEQIVSGDDIYNRVRIGVDEKVDAIFASKVDQVIKAKVDEIVSQGFERSYRKTDSFGRPVGQETSISKELESMISGYWSESVDRSGAKSTNGYGTMTRAEWMMAKVCADDFSAEMKQHVVNVGGALKDHFRTVLNEHIGILLSDVFKVNSTGDRALKNNGGNAIIQPKANPIGAA